MTAAQARLRSFIKQHDASFWLLLVVTVAAVLRFAGLTSQSYWFDELFSAWYSNPAHSLARVIELTIADVHPPLHQIGMWLSYKALGYNEFAGRLPSALAGIALIPVIYALGRELFDRRTGLYAAALAVPNYYLLYYAQEARSYAFLVFLSSLSLLLFVRALRSTSWPNVLGYVAATAALLYTHYFAFVWLVIQACIFCVYWLLLAKSDRPLLIRAGVAAVLLLAASVPLVPVITQHADVKDFWINQPPFQIAAQYFIGYFRSLEIALCIALLIVFASLATGVQRFREARTGWTTFGVIALLMAVALGFLLPWARGLVAQPVITDRNTIILVPPLLVLAAWGLRNIPLLPLQRLAGLLVLGLSLYQLLFGIDYYRAAWKNQYREITVALSAYKPVLPVYAVVHNETKYNVYFEQLNSPLRAREYKSLEESLQAGTAAPLFWLAGGFLFGLDTGIEERFGLVRVALYKFLGVEAELLLDPQRAKSVVLESSVIAGNGANWISAQPFVWPGAQAELLLVLDPALRRDQLRKVQVDLLDVRGQLLETHTTELGAIPSTFQIRSGIASGKRIRLVVRMPAGELTPALWVINPDSSAS